MRAEAFQRGDMDALEAAVHSCQDLVWVLTRRGFLTHRDGLTFWVHGLEDRDAAETLVVHLIADLIGPTRRAGIEDEAGLIKAALVEVRDVMWAQAERAGRITSVTEDETGAVLPSEVEDLDALIEQGAAPRQPSSPPDAQAEAWMQDAQKVCTRVLTAGDERTRTLVELRIRKGHSTAEVAAHFTCGAAAIAAHESRLRRHLSRALAKALPAAPHGPATIDTVLAEEPWSATPPAITQARIRRDVLRRTFQEEPKPYSARLVWGLGAAAVAAVAWALMFFGFIPNPNSDTYPDPAVQARCNGPCTAGQDLKVWVLAPRDATHVAIALRGARGPDQLLLTNPAGGTLRLPFGAGVKLSPIPYPVQLTESASTASELVAVFSDRTLSERQLSAVLLGQTGRPGTQLTSVKFP